MSILAATDVAPLAPIALAHPSNGFFPAGILFALVVLGVGFIPPALTFSLRPQAAAEIGLTDVPVPAWVFVAVWLVIYPSMGVAAWHIWQLRAAIDASVPLAVLLAGFLQTISFWFTNSLRSTAVMDATGILLAATAVWVLSRSSGEAALWLLPWMAWMPITFCLKVSVLTGRL